MKKPTKSVLPRKCHLFNAKRKILGRLAAEASRILSGKNKVSFTPHIDEGDFVVIVNADKIEVSGNKRKQKIYHRFSGYPGGITSISLEDRLRKDSREVIREAVYGMMAKNKLRDKMIRRLFIYHDEQHTHKIDKTH